MKYALIIIVLLLVPQPTLAKRWVHADCATLIESRIRQESMAENEADAGDHAAAYLDFQGAVEYRANCADETSGRDRQWNQFYEAYDYYGLAAAAINTETWKDNTNGFVQKAHQITNDLMNEHIPGTLGGMVRDLWKSTAVSLDTLSH